MTHNPHIYTFQIHDEILSEKEFLFNYFRPSWWSSLLCCKTNPSYWSVSFNDPHQLPLNHLQQYAYNRMIDAGFLIRNKARITLFEARGGFVSIPESLLSGVNMVLVVTKENCDSGLLNKRQVPMKHPYLKRLTIEQVSVTEMKEGMGIMFNEKHYIEFVSGKYQAIFLSFEL